jgi:alpha-galactosidase
MIHFNPETSTFNLHLKHSYYAFQIDSAGRVVHLGWGPRPETATETERIRGSIRYQTYPPHLSFITQHRPDEILAFGDVTTYQETLKVAFPTAGSPLARGESPHLPVRDLRLRYDQHEIVVSGSPGLSPAHGLPTGRMSERETLRVHLIDPVQPFKVILNYRLTPEHDILERWIELKNEGDHTVTVDTCYFASIHVPPGTIQLTTLSGSWAAEFTPTRQDLNQGIFILESRSVQTGHQANPFFMLNTPDRATEEGGTVYFGQLAYSGSWRITFEQITTRQIRVHAGYNPFDFKINLAPGDTHITPALICGVCQDGWGGASRRMHDFLLERVLPAPRGSQPWRPVLYNSWEDTYFDLDYDHQVTLARRAAAIGVELFCLDDGWFGDRRSDRAGLGDWYASPAIFPKGLRPLVDEVHQLGMKFGLWVEPEMVNRDSNLYRMHPDWVLHFPGRERSEARNQLILDLGRTEVVEYLQATLDSLVTENAIDFFKWDMNRNVSEPGSVAGQAIWYRHCESVYRIMDYLRRRHPNLDIQSCSGGGGRVDAGILARTDQVWVSDNTDALDRIQIQEGFSLCYPARVMEAWVTHNQNRITNRVWPLALRFDVAMRGILGIGTNLAGLSDVELAECAAYIAYYKRIRHIIQSGHLYRLQNLQTFGESVIEYVMPDGREAVCSVILRDFRPGSIRPLSPLRGLNSSGEYQVFDRDFSEFARLSGFELMTLGIPSEPDQYPGYSRTWYLTQID